MAEFSVGQHVMVDMAGFQSGGVTMGQGASMGGVITAISGDEYTIKLSGSAGGVDTVKVPASRLQPAG